MGNRTTNKEPKKKNPYKNKFTADFETTTNPDDCRVWAWALNGIENTQQFEYGNSLEGFMNHIKKMGNVKLYFHNLKFDGQFIVSYLLENGFQFCDDKSKEWMFDKSFSVCVSKEGLFYSIRIVFGNWNKKKHFVEIYDSLKIIPFSVEGIAKSFGLKESKLNINYTAYRKPGHQLTQAEVDYIHSDVKITAEALRILFSQGLTKMTQASNALFDYKTTISKFDYEEWFPTPYYDADVRKSYKGGFTWLNPKYKDKEVGAGLVLDVNSLYPWAMYTCRLPYSNPIYYTGEYVPDGKYDVYTQQFSCRFRLKKNHIPTVQIKGSSRFVETQYLESSATYDWCEETQEWIECDEPITLTMTSVDLKLFFDHYDVEIDEWFGGYKFKSRHGMFSTYIEKWMQVKEESTKNGNKGMRTLAKLMLNALYGKFATSTTTQSKIPYMEDGIVKYMNGPEMPKKDSSILYIPVGAFITAYAREKTIRSAQMVYDKFIYADTDSLHLDMELPEELTALTNDDLEKMTTQDFIDAGVDFPVSFDIDPYKIGAWKVESRFFRGKYIRAKTYLEDWNRPDTWNGDGYEAKLLNITCAGMPKSCYDHVTWDNFHEGSRFPGKLIPKTVQHGTVLIEVDFSIKRTCDNRNAIVKSMRSQKMTFTNY